MKAWFDGHKTYEYEYNDIRDTNKKEKWSHLNMSNGMGLVERT